MSMRSFWCGLRYNGVRNVIAGIGGCQPRTLLRSTDSSLPSYNAVHGHQQLSTVRHGHHQQTPIANASSTSASTGIGYLQHAVGVVAEQALVSRLAAVWQMPTECLLAQVHAVSSLLRPSGLGTSAHALWMLVRSPELRNATEHQLRTSFRQLQQLVSHLNPDRSALLATVYKRPWMLAAMISPAQASAAWPSAAPGPANWRQEMAAILLEVQQQNSSRQGSADSTSTGQTAAAASSIVGNSNVRAADDSPMLPLAAVRAYLAVKEPVQALWSVFNRLPGLSPATSSSSPSPVTAHNRQDKVLVEYDQAASSTSTPSSSTDASTCCSGRSSSSVEHEQLLQQVLAASPQLILLPPDLLLSRWQMLTSGLLGAAACAQSSAAQLATTCPYLLLDYADHAACGHHRSMKAYDPNLGGSDYEAAAAC